MCVRKLSLQLAKGKYLYYYCLGLSTRKASSGCREPYVAADILERQVEDIYQHIQLPANWVAKLREQMET